jgi:PPM family protein phosphatase
VNVPPFEPGFLPHSATVRVVFGASSSRGASRLINEDHYLVIRLGRFQQTLLTSLRDDAVTSRFDEEGYAMIVADGVGRPGAGESASHLALVTLVYLVRHHGEWSLRIDDQTAQELMRRVERFYRHVDSTIVQGRRTGTVRMDQTTLTATFGAGRDLFFAHVGHSRAYLFRAGQLLRLTRDHTVDRYQSTTPIGPLIDVNTASRDLRHILTDAIGMDGPAAPVIDLERIQLDDNDRVLVCTNGLTDAIEDERIAEVLAQKLSPDAQCERLTALAKAAGGDDDITAVVAHYRIPP